MPEKIRAFFGVPFRLLMIAGASLVFTAFQVGLTLIVWLGDWPASLARDRLNIIGGFGLANLVILAICIITIASVKVSAHGPGGTSLEVEGDS
jgi:hypothetical protein